MMFQPSGGGSDSTSFGINYLSANPNAESDTSGWSTFADAAATTPVDGTGGSPNSTWTRTTSSPLRGTGSFLFTKSSGASRQGEGVSFDFTIDAADKGKVLQGSFDYSIASGTFVDDAMSVWIYDITNTTLIPCSPYLLKNHTLAAEKFPFEFQTSSSSTSYRLIIFVPVTTNSSNTLKFDNFVVGPQAKLYGSPVTDWVSYTPVMTHNSGTFTNTTVSGQWRRVGDSMEITGKIDHTGTPGTFSGILISIPSGYAVDANKIVASNYNRIGVGSILDNGSTVYDMVVQYNTTTKVELWVIDASSTYSRSGTPTQAVPISWASGDTLFWTAKFPITGWSSSVVMSSDADTRIITAQALGDPASATSGNPIIFPTKYYDTHNAYNTSTGKFVAPKPGYLRVHGYLSSATASLQITLEVNDSGVVNIGSTDANGRCAISGVVPVLAGDSVHISANGTIDVNGASSLIFEYLQGPAQIAASESVEAHYSTAAGQSIETGATGEILDFGTVITDSHGSVTTGASWKFTAPKSGTYSVKASATLASGGGWAAGEYMFLQLYKNGVSGEYIAVSFQQATHTTNVVCAGSTDIKLIAGDYIQLYVAQNSGGTIALQAAAGQNFISILSR
jgi:hypothetical protein